jgi:hypothetical protein
MYFISSSYNQVEDFSSNRIRVEFTNRNFEKFDHLTIWFDHGTRNLNRARALLQVSSSVNLLNNLKYFKVGLLT